jgi:hypothetical protein
MAGFLSRGKEGIPAPSAAYTEDSLSAALLQPAAQLLRRPHPPFVLSGQARRNL